MDFLKSLTTTAQTLTLAGALSGCYSETFPPTRRVITDPDRYAETRLPHPLHETAENSSIRLNDLLRNAYETDSSGRLRIVPDIYKTYQAYYHRILKIVRASPNFAERSDIGALVVHDYILNNQNISEEESLLLRALVLGESSLIDVLCTVACNERNQALPQNPRDMALLEERQRIMHWALYRYAGSLAYEAATRVAYRHDTQKFNELPQSVKEYINHLNYDNLKRLYTSLDANGDSLFNPEDPSYRRDHSHIVGLLESGCNQTLSLQEARDAFVRIKIYTAATLRSRGDILTPITHFDVAPSQHYWTGFQEGFAPFMREANIAVESPDRLDDTRLMRYLVKRWWAPYRAAYNNYTAGQRTYHHINATEQWFQRTFSEFGSSVTNARYGRYRNDMTTEASALRVEDEHHIWTEGEIERVVEHEGVAVLSPDQLPTAWRTLLENVTLDIPFPGQENFKGNAFEFIKKYTARIYFTKVGGREKNHLGTIATSERAIFVSVGAHHTYSTLRIIDTIAHEAYHLAYQREVVARNPTMANDLLLNERNAYLVGMRVIESAIPTVLRADILSNYHPDSAENDTERGKAEMTLASLSFGLSNISFTFSLIGISDPDDFYTQPMTGAAWCYLNNQGRVDDANHWLGYPDGNKEFRYDMGSGQPNLWRSRYPQFHNSHLVESFSGALQVLFGLAGFDMTKTSLELENATDS